MKKLLVITLLTIVSLSSFAKKKSKEFAVHLSDVSSILAKYEDNQDLNFIKDSIMYYQIEVDKYDNVFKESAIIYASVKELSGSISTITSGDFDMTFALDIAKFGADLPQLLLRITALQEELTSFNPKKDFMNIKLLKKIGTATKGIVRSGKQLGYTAKELPKIASKLAEVTKVINQSKE